MTRKTDSDSKWFLWVLGLVLIVLKLTGVIDWSWIWVLSPFWGALALAVVVSVIYLIKRGLQ